MGYTFFRPIVDAPNTNPGQNAHAEAFGETHAQKRLEQKSEAKVGAMLTRKIYMHTNAPKHTCTQPFFLFSLKMFDCCLERV